MQKAGGIIAIIAGIFGVFSAFATLFIGGIGGAFEAEGASTVSGLGWGGLFFSFVVIILGAMAIGSKSKKIGVFLIIASVLGAILGGTLVAIFMVLALAGGIIATMGIKKRQENQMA